MTTVEQPELLTVAELAEYLRVSTKTAYQLAADGAAPAVKVGNQWRIPRAALESQLAGTDEKSAA